LIFTRINELIAVIFESTKETVKSNVYRSWLHHGSVIRVKLDSAGLDFGLDIAI
jgi:hypothetical protein